MKTRTFEDSKAVRAAVPLLVGLSGPSGCGKTFSALRLATGMQSVTGGQIFVIDTEAKRALHYADQFDFRHVPFGAPFSPLDYLAAIEHCVNKGAKIIVIDSMSHEHEGPGGVLEWHAEKLEKLSSGDYKRAQKLTMLAWQEPKAARRRLLNTIVQLGVNMIFCFRAKEKLKMVRGKDPIPLGWMPIAGPEFVYEMTCSMLLPPGSQGVPDWRPEHPGEKAMTKLPIQFQALAKYDGPITEKIGENMATWAAGGSSPRKQEVPPKVESGSDPGEPEPAPDSGTDWMS
ncbi:MAG: AAA family ATPase [bacterium]|nr:AAA family ATPase [bacterium]